MKLLSSSDDGNERIIVLLIAIGLFCLVLAKWLFLGFDFFDRPFFFGDFLWRWEECRYVLQGINPLDIVHGTVPIDEGIGTLGREAGTVPWAYSLGNVFVFGFLPYKYAVWAGLISFVVVASLTVYCLYKYVLSRIGEKNRCVYSYALLAIVFLLLPHYWLTSILFGNYGTICSCLLIMMATQIDERPYLAGILLGLASLKPQLAFLFYISLLMRGQWKILTVASCLVLCSWIITSLLTKTYPIDLLSQMWGQAMGYREGVIVGYSYYGLFTVLADYQILSISQSVLASSILGIIVVVVVSKYLMVKEWSKNDLFLYLSVPAIVSTFWNYQQNHDKVILIFLAVPFVIEIARSRLNMFGKVSLIIAPAFILYFHIGSLVEKIDHFIVRIKDSLGIHVFEPFFILFDYYAFTVFCISWFLVILFLARRENKSLAS